MYIPVISSVLLLLKILGFGKKRCSAIAAIPRTGEAHIWNNFFLDFGKLNLSHNGATPFFIGSFLFSHHLRTYLSSCSFSF